jgi:starch synthase
VIDYGDEGGYGIRFTYAAVGDVTQAIWRAVELYNDAEKLKEIRQQMMKLDFSWETSVKQYIDLYESL